MRITQVKLKQECEVCQNCNIHMVCWLPAEYNLKHGNRVTLKDDPGVVWIVQEIYSSQEHYEINRKWDVGGL